jgi:hypothetical protein
MASDTKATDRTVLMEQPAPAAATKPPARGRAKRWLVGLAAGAAVLGAAYGTGRFQTSSRVDEAQALASAKAEQWSVEHSSALRLEARRKLHLALIALDARNFGIAQEQLAAAAVLLAATHPDGELDKLQKQIAAYQLKASENVGAERDQVNDWIGRFDGAVPAAKP